MEYDPLVCEDIEAAFEFFSRAENLEAITPPLLRFRITSPTPIDIRKGSMIEYRLRLHGVPVSWRTRIEEWDPPHGFVDRQLRGLIIRFPFVAAQHMTRM